MSTFLLRVGGAMALLPFTYEDVERDKSALPQALLVVLLSSLATGLIYYDEFGVTGLAVGVLIAILAWATWSWLAYHIGVRWLPEPSTQADWGELLRVTGFATAPALLRVVAVIPEAGRPVFLLTWLWMAIAFVIAVRQALDYTSTWRSVVVCLLGALIYLTVLVVLPSACVVYSTT